MIKSNFVCHIEGHEFETGVIPFEFRFFVGDVVNVDEYVIQSTHQVIDDDTDFVVAQVYFDIVTREFTYTLEPQK